MAKHLRPEDVPGEAKIVSVDVFDADGVRTGTKDANATYFWRTPDGDVFVSQASAREKEMFEIDKDVPTIQVNKYSVEGDFLGGPWTVRE